MNFLFKYAPSTTRVTSENHLEIGGCNLVELKKNFGSPLYIIDELSLRENCQRYQKTLEKLYPKNLVIFASKALCLKSIFSIIKQEKLGLDVVSAGEFLTARSIDFPEDKVYLHGNNKQYEELELLSQKREARVVLDNYNDLNLLEQIFEESQESSNLTKSLTKRKLKALIRLTPGVECHTHEYIRTGQNDSKFGFDLPELKQVLSRAQRISNLEIVGLHAHIGSQIFEIAPFIDSLKILLKNYQALPKDLKFELQELNLGGGIGVFYTEKDDPPKVEFFLEQITRALKKELSEISPSIELPRLILEPGRSLVASSGVTLYTIGSQKQIPGVKNYLSVDGGMADNPRVITYQAQYEATLANRVKQKSSEKLKNYCIAGRYCESGDLLIKEILLPEDVETGELLAVFGTGAYNYSMSSQYNRVPRPAMVLVNRGNADLILRAESYQDLMSHDLLPERLS